MAPNTATNKKPTLALKHALRFHDIIGGIHVPVDDGVDKLNRKYTLLVFLFLALPIFTKQYIGDPIECFAPVYFAEHQSRYINSYCWTQSTYYMVPVGDPEDDGDQVSTRIRKMLYLNLNLNLALLKFFFFFFCFLSTFPYLSTTFSIVIKCKITQLLPDKLLYLSKYEPQFNQRLVEKSLKPSLVWERSCLRKQSYFELTEQENCSISWKRRLRLILKAQTTSCYNYLLSTDSQQLNITHRLKANKRTNDGSLIVRLNWLADNIWELSLLVGIVIRVSHLDWQFRNNSNPELKLGSKWEFELENPKSNSNFLTP